MLDIGLFMKAEKIMKKPISVIISEKILKGEIVKCPKCNKGIFKPAIEVSKDEKKDVFCHCYECNNCDNYITFD